MALWKIPKNVPPDGYLVLDIETTSNKDKNLRAVDGERPYMIGACGDLGDGMKQAIAYTINRELFPWLTVEKFKVLVGHNIKFDLEHLRRHDEHVKVGMGANQVKLYDYVKENAVVLDTAFITYLHSGHREQFPSLERACEYWGVPIHKSLDIGVELEKVGYDITKVPGLDSYLINDLEMTTALINKMLEDPWVTRNFSWILAMHDGYMGTHEIEYNGMHVDPSRLMELTKDVQQKYDDVTNELRVMVGRNDFEPSSNDHVAAYLFGGDVVIETRVPNGVYASGKKAGLARYRIERETVSFVPHAPPPLPEWKSAKTGKYSVNEDILLAIGTEFTDKLLEYRELAKLRGTYLEGLGKHLRVIDGSYYVFPQINVTATATGRTSSSKPNMQNNPTHDSVGVASIYTSRFGKDAGILCEVDFKQIEILALAILSGDEQLRSDILSGRDIHAETGRGVFGPKMTKEQRRVIKTINFGLIYGGGAETLAAQAKVSKGIAAKAIRSFYTRYPDVRKYFDKHREKVQFLLDLHGKLTGEILANGSRQKVVTVDSFTGRRYSYKDYYSQKSTSVEVSYTETRNYPIQGLATGDLVLCALGKVWRKVVRHPEEIKLVGVVHDSLRFDIKLDKLDEFVRELKCTLEDAGNLLNSVTHTSQWDLPVKVTFSKGTDFFNMEEFEVAV